MQTAKCKSSIAFYLLPFAFYLAMLSIAIIARDEEQYLPGALESVRGLADEILLLLDSRTRDGSAALGRAAGARVLIEPWRGFPAQRNRALDLCAGDWVLFLDADER